MPRQVPASDLSVGPLARLARSFDLHLRAANRSPRTVETYLEAVGQLDRWLAAEGIEEVAEVTRSHVAAFMAELVAKRSPSTASVPPRPDGLRHALPLARGR